MRSPAEIRTFAREIHIDIIGFATTEPLPGLDAFTRWLEQGSAAGMQWLANDPEARFTPTSLLPDAQTAICIGQSYYRPDIPPPAHLARYACFPDYHEIIRNKLDALAAFLTEDDPETHCRPCVDTSAIAEKPLLVRAGLGWQGRNSLIINEHYGSWLCFGILLINRKLPPDSPVPGRCGSCRACLDACPTGALRSNHTLHAPRCLSYLTIEAKDTTLPPTHGRLFGCDSCQQACPWNQHPTPGADPAFTTPTPLATLTTEQLAVLDNQTWNKLRKHTPLSRLSHTRLHRNLAAMGGEKG